MLATIFTLPKQTGARTNNNGSVVRETLAQLDERDTQRSPWHVVGDTPQRMQLLLRGIFAVEASILVFVRVRANGALHGGHLLLVQGAGVSDLAVRLEVGGHLQRSNRRVWGVQLGLIELNPGTESTPGEERKGKRELGAAGRGRALLYGLDEDDGSSGTSSPCAVDTVDPPLAAPDISLPPIDWGSR